MAKAKKAAPKEETPNLPAVAGSLKLPEGVKVKRHVTLPSLAIKKSGEQRILFLMDAMRVSKIKEKKTEDGKPAREPATICTVGDVEDGSMYIFIIPAVVKENLLRDYPNDSYVGKSFVIQNKGKRSETQRYNDFAIAEVDVPANDKFTIPALPDKS